MKTNKKTIIWILHTFTFLMGMVLTILVFSSKSVTAKIINIIIMVLITILTIQDEYEQHKLWRTKK